MSNDKAKRLNLFDYFGFPDRQKRDETLQICDINKLRLSSVEANNPHFLDIFFERYCVWSNHINNFSSHLWLHFLLMYYHYSQNPLDTIDIGKFQSPEAAHKIYFDSFAEDVSLYLTSYFDKHLEMFNDLYDLKQLSGKKHNLSRRKIIREMEKVEVLKKLANEYRKVEQSESFQQIVDIRNSFVHNRSLSYYGMEVTKVQHGVYASGHSGGISTMSTYNSVCELLRNYEQLCVQVNDFIKEKIEVFMQEIRSGEITKPVT